jgi:hypothetical protein
MTISKKKKAFIYTYMYVPKTRITKKLITKKRIICRRWTAQKNEKKKFEEGIQYFTQVKESDKI